MTFCKVVPFFMFTLTGLGVKTTVNKAAGESLFKLMFGYVSRSIHDAFLANEVDTDHLISIIKP
jgi:hypothetical protein